MPRRLLGALVACAASLSVLPAVASAAEPTPFGHPCKAENGVRFCPATTGTDPASLARRIPSFDGSPIDADVTLPAEGQAPFPTIVMIHGYGGSKADTESTGPSDGFDNVGIAKRGYAVVSISTRGFGLSCGSSVSRTAACDGKGWIHLDDQRYEVHDVQYLLGLLVDEGISEARALGATGGSYGGGLSLELAYLKNRVRNVDGSYSPWKTTKGTRLSLAAAYPLVPWSDLSNALVPNGRADGFGSPPGVQIESYVNGLYVAGNLAGWVSKPGIDPGADLTTWKNLTNAGEPYGTAAKSALKTLATYHGVWNLKGTPAPLLLASGWTDDLFPPIQTLRIYDKLRKKSKKAPVWLQYGDFGHARGGHHEGDRARMNAEGVAFFAHYLQGSKKKLPKPGSVLAMGQSCPNTARNGIGPWTASSYAALQKGTQTLTAAGTQTITSTGGDHALSAALDPLSPTGGDACSTYPAGIGAGTAVATKTSKGFTYLGMGHISAKVKTTGPYGQIDARLWDVSAGKQLLVDRSVYRLTPNQRGTVKFDLHGNGYRFAKGHTVKLELLGWDKPTHRPSNGTFAVKISKIRLALPTR
jgi:predicted acyl esterase